ncbi:MAG: hypothetical protein OYH76_18260 [Defluviicoccus sp.]|nr:hypothetical protein [Defluviicoccus sp.]MDE0277843.1 hypothetical protein [Defluviicoccus sp.]
MKMIIGGAVARCVALVMACPPGALAAEWVNPAGKTWNTWLLCTWSKQYPYPPRGRDPVKVQCLENNGLKADGRLTNGSKFCRDVLGAKGVLASFSEHTVYASGTREEGFLGHGRELCAAYCRKYAAKIRIVTCDPEMVSP